MAALQQRTIDLLRGHQEAVLAQWAGQLAAQTQDGRIGARELESQTREFWRLFQAALSTSSAGGVGGKEWQEIRHFLEQLSRDRVLKGFSSSETASFLFSLKRPVFELLQNSFAEDAGVLGEQLWAVSELIDDLGLHSVKAFQKTREEVIQRQQEEMLELSTPVVKLWKASLRCR